MLVYPRSKRPLGLITLIFLSFIALGMPDGLLGVGWPTIRADFGIPLDAIGWLLFSVMSGYLASSFFSGELLKRWRVGKVLIVSCLITGAGLIGYTLVSSWWMMVALGVLAGLGAGAIDSGLNAYVADNFGPGLMQWLHASYGIGVTSGPLVMTYFLSQFNAWRPGCVLVGGFQLLLAFTFWLTLPMWQSKGANSGEHDEEPYPASQKASVWQTIAHPTAWIGFVLFFLYTGSEVTVGTWTYSLLTEARGVQPEFAGLFAGSYWFMFTIGRILAGLVTRKLDIRRLVLICFSAALLGAALLLWNPFALSELVAVGVIGFAFAPIFPGLVSGTLARVGRTHMDNAIGIQMAFASLGGTALTSLVGLAARRWGLEVMPAAMVVFLSVAISLYWFSLRRQSMA